MTEDFKKVEKKNSKKRQNDETTLERKEIIDVDRRTDLQTAHLPRKAPKDTLPMPVADRQKQKCSRNSESSAKIKGGGAHSR